MILPVYTEPNPILHQPAQTIVEITPEIKQLAFNMRETMLKARGVGLAAPQIGQSLSMCVIEYVDEEGRVIIPFYALVNPRVTWKSLRKVKYEEGCLSFPGIEADINRPDRVRVKAKNLEGETLEIEAEGYLARILQHEIDHLNGIVFTDYVSKKKLKSRPVENYQTI